MKPVTIVKLIKILESGHKITNSKCVFFKHGPIGKNHTEALKTAELWYTNCSAEGERKNGDGERCAIYGNGDIAGSADRRNGDRERGHARWNDKLHLCFLLQRSFLPHPYNIFVFLSKMD